MDNLSLPVALSGLVPPACDAEAGHQRQHSRSSIADDSAGDSWSAIQRAEERREQADPLPTRIELGASWKLAFIAKYVSDIDVRLAGDVVTNKSAEDPSARIGTDITYQKTVHLRGGYIANDTDGANASVGFGLGTGRLLFDIARTFGGLSEDAGKTPTYISLRFLF